MEQSQKLTPDVEENHKVKEVWIVKRHVGPIRHGEAPLASLL